jgi:hypothetical protein
VNLIGLTVTRLVLICNFHIIDEAKVIAPIRRRRGSNRFTVHRLLGLIADQQVRDRFRKRVLQFPVEDRLILD